MKTCTLKTPTVLALAVVAVLGFSSCHLVMGSGTVFIWNNSDAAASVDLIGSSGGRFHIPPNSGHKVERAVVGEYELRVEGADTQTFKLSPDSIEIRNVGVPACFARTDVSGMYRPGRHRIQVLETYKEKAGFTLIALDVFPGEVRPPERPKSPFAFQQLFVVPCEHTGSSGDVVDYLTKLR